MRGKAVIILLHLGYHVVVDIGRKMDRIHIEIQVINNIRIILEVIQLNIVAGKQCLGGSLGSIENLIQLPAPGHIVPPQKGIGRIKEIEGGLRMGIYLLYQQIHIGIYDIGVISAGRS